MRLERCVVALMSCSGRGASRGNSVGEAAEEHNGHRLRRELERRALLLAIMTLLVAGARQVVQAGSCDGRGAGAWRPVLLGA